jgi:hypothetical protein
MVAFPTHEGRAGMEFRPTGSPAPRFAFWRIHAILVSLLRPLAGNLKAE